MAQAIDTMQERSRVSSTSTIHDLDRVAYIPPVARKTDEVQTPRRHASRWILLITFAAVAAGGLVTWWLHAQHFEFTDDAQIEGHLNSISARINGNVAYINPDVENNQYVEAGTLLLELDTNDYQVALDSCGGRSCSAAGERSSAALNVPIATANAYSQLHAAEAALDEAAASVDAEEANLTSIRHKVEQDQALYARAERDRARYQALVDTREISRSEYDARETEAIAAAQVLASDRALITTAEQRITQARSRVAQKQAAVEAGQTAPQQVSEAETRLQSSLGETDQAESRRADSGTQSSVHENLRSSERSDRTQNGGGRPAYSTGANPADHRSPG